MKPLPPPISGPLYKGLVGALGAMVASGTVKRLRARTPRRVVPAQRTVDDSSTQTTAMAEAADALVSGRAQLPPGITSI